MRGMNKPGVSGYFGVRWCEPSHKWIAQIRDGETIKYLGLHADIKEAARAFDKASFKLRGKKANLNFPRDFK